MRIDIQQKHIDEGQPGRSNDCAIARAIKDMGHERVFVSGRFAEVDGRSFELDMDARRFVFMFDHNKEFVKPTMLTLSPYHPDSRQLREYAHVMYSKPPMMVMDEGEMPKQVTMDYTKWVKPMQVHPGEFSKFDYKVMAYGLDTGI